MTRQTGDSAIWRARRESPHRREGWCESNGVAIWRQGTQHRVVYQPLDARSRGGALRVEPVVGVGLGDVDGGV